MQNKTLGSSAELKIFSVSYQFADSSKIWAIWTAVHLTSFSLLDSYFFNEIN